MSNAALACIRAMRDEGTQQRGVDAMQTREELYAVLGYHAYERKLDELFAKRAVARARDPQADAAR